MKHEARVWSNAIWNSAGALLNAAAGFITLPLLVKHLGVEFYGIWLLMNGITGYISVLDFGISVSLGRMIAASRAREDWAELRCAAGIGTKILWALSLVGIVLTVLFLPIFFRLFQTPEAHSSDITIAFLVLGVATAISLPVSGYGAVVLGYERYDWANFAEICSVVLRTALVILTLLYRPSLAMLAAAIALSLLPSWLAKYLMSRHLTGHLPPAEGVRFPFRELLTFGRTYTLLNAARNATPVAVQVIIGHLIGPAGVGLFAVPRQLQQYANWLVVAFSQAITPRAAYLKASSQDSAQRDLLLNASKICSLMAVGATTMVITFGASFFRLWQPTLPPHAYILCCIVFLGETIPMAQWATYSMILGLNRPKVLTRWAIAELAAVTVLCAASALSFGLDGVATAAAAIATLIRGLVQARIGCRLLDIEVTKYVASVLAPPLCTALAFCGVAFYTHLGELSTWGGLVLSAVLFGFSYAAVTLLILFPLTPLQRFFFQISRR